MPCLLWDQESNLQQPSQEQIINTRLALAFQFHSSWFSERRTIQTFGKCLTYAVSQYSYEASKDNCPVRKLSHRVSPSPWALWSTSLPRSGHSVLFPIYISFRTPEQFYGIHQSQKWLCKKRLTQNYLTSGTVQSFGDIFIANFQRFAHVIIMHYWNRLVLLLFHLY